MFQPGPKLTRQRKILKRAIGLQAVENYEGIIQSEIMKLQEIFSGFSGDLYPLVAQ
jgi:hypothetical protein